LSQTANCIKKKNIAEKFPWYVKMCKEHRGLTVEDGIPSDRSNRKLRHNRRNDEQQQPQQGQQQQQQQQFQFSLPANMPPVPLESTIQIIPPQPPQAAPSQGTSFAFGRQPSAPATTQHASGGNRWVLNQQGVWQLE